MIPTRTPDAEVKRRLALWAIDDVFTALRDGDLDTAGERLDEAMRLVAEMERGERQ